ncbi:CC172 protein, partial [Jacana jacana]|nr:CC172 protein [Jacana jacana]
LSWKVQHLSEKRFNLEMLKKREDSLEKQKAELINQKSCLLKILVYVKRKMTEEEDNFTREVTEFNNEYGLTSNRDLLIKKKVKTEINDLENEAALLKNEMESMEHQNDQLNALQLQKSELKQDIFTLQSELKGI